MHACHAGYKHDHIDISDNLSVCGYFIAHNFTTLYHIDLTVEIDINHKLSILNL